jgi:hypothetical protein
MPYSIPADQILPLLPLPEPPSSSPNFASNSDSGIPSTTTTSPPKTPPRLTINTTPPTPTSPSHDDDDDDDALGSPTTRRGGYLQYSPTTSHYPQAHHSRGRAGHRRSYTYMYPHHLHGGDAGANGNVDASEEADANAYAVHSTPLNDNHLPRRKSVSTASSAGQALGSMAAEERGAAAMTNGNANGTTTNGHKKPTFQLGQPEDDGSTSEDENSSDAAAASENYYPNTNAPPSTTHPIRSKPHQHSTQQHHTHIPPHTLPRQHLHPLQRQEDEDEEERHLGLPPLKLKLKQQREPSFEAVPFPRSSPLHSPVPGAVAAAGGGGGVGARQGGYPFPHTPPSVSKSQSQPPLPLLQTQPTQPTQTHLRVSSETTNSSSATTSNTSNPTRPTVQRTSSTPLLLLANGRPLKSSLKGSSSSPNIPFPSQSMVPSILWPDLHRKQAEGGEAQERDVEGGQGQGEGGEQVSEGQAGQEQAGQGSLEPERQHHTVHQRAASAPSVPSVSISTGGGSASSPPARPPPFTSSSSSSSSTSTTLPHARPHPLHPNPHNHHHAHAGVAKNVHFPSSEEGGLATVRVFNRSARPASLSLGARPAGEETETETEGTGTEGEGWGGGLRWGGWGSGKGHFFPRVGAAGGTGLRRENSVNSKAEVEKDSEDVLVDDEKSSYIPRVGAHLGDANVYLESLGFVEDGLSFSFLCVVFCFLTLN